MRSTNGGLTLVEVIVSVVVLVITSALTAVGIRYINGYSRLQSVLQMQQEVQTILYQVTRDIRNANSIVTLSTMAPHELVLTTFNFNRSYDVADNPDMFNPIHTSTITYLFVDDGRDTYLHREKKVDDAIIEQKDCLKNLLKPEPSTSGEDHIFAHTPPTSTNADDPVEVVFRIDRSAYGFPVQIYKSQSAIRSRASQR